MSRNPQVSWSALFGALVFSIIHFVAAFTVSAAPMVLGDGQRAKNLSGTLANICWFPAHQIYTFLNIRNSFLSFAFPISDSLLWGAVIFAVWRANYADNFKFSLRFLLIATTILVALL